jgi:GNAT superfamily N-acetyltransferase
VKDILLLWHGTQPIGICVFASPPMALRHRSRFFGLTGRWSRMHLQALNRQVVTLSRVVLHPTYRGAGLAAAFVRASCCLVRWPWIEALAEMGHLNPFFERAGFVKVGHTPRGKASRRQHSAIYGGRRGTDGQPRLLTAETHLKSQYAEPIYYVFDNRANIARQTVNGSRSNTQTNEWTEAEPVVERTPTVGRPADRLD